MEDILAVLTRDDSFQARRSGGQVSLAVCCLLLTDVTHSPLGGGILYGWLCPVKQSACVRTSRFR